MFILMRGVYTVYYVFFRFSVCVYISFVYFHGIDKTVNSSYSIKANHGSYSIQIYYGVCILKRIFIIVIV